jgi:hypothetical protein
LEPLVGEIVLAVEIDGALTHYGAVLHGREEFLPARGVLFLRNLLGEIEVVPADADRLKTAGLEQVRDIFD